jgi:hypothetical protein
MCFPKRSSGLSLFEKKFKSDRNRKEAHQVMKTAMSTENLSDPRFREIFKEKIRMSNIQNMEIVFESLAMVLLKSHTTLDALADLWKGINILENEFGFRFQKLIVNPGRFYAVMTKPSY